MFATQSRSRLGMVYDRAGKPADGDQPEELGGPAGRIELDDGDGVLRPIGDIEIFPGLSEGQGVRRCPKEVGGVGFGPYGFDDGVVL